MKPNRNPGPKLLFAVLLALCLTPVVARAQTTPLQGKFRLQTEARWGKASLPPGDYSLTVDPRMTAHDTIFVIIQSADGKKSAFAMATATAASEPGGSYLFISDDGIRRVRFLNLPQLNVSLAFGPLNKRDREELRASKSEVVPVAVAQK